MKHFFYLMLIGLLFVMNHCTESEMVEGVDAGGITITNTTDNELSVVSKGTTTVEFLINPRENTSLQEYSSVTFTSTNSEIFEINEDGVITGKRNGVARLIVAASTDEYEVKGSCVVRVTGQVFVENITVDETIRNIRINIYENPEFQINPADYTVTPGDALITDITFASSNPGIAQVDENGLITAVSGGEVTISILSRDGSNVRADITVNVLAPIFTWYLEERQSFEFDYRPGLILYPLNSDGAYGNDWNLLIDEGSGWQNSFISMSKPGRAMAPSAQVGDIFIPIDMKEELKFNQIFWRHRSTNTFARLRVWEFRLEGSDDGENFIVLEENVEIPGATEDGAATVDATVLLDNTYQYRYIKLVPTVWHTSLGNTMQVSDLKIGYDESRDPDFGN